MCSDAHSITLTHAFYCPVSHDDNSDSRYDIAVGISFRYSRYKVFTGLVYVVSIVYT